MDVVCIESFCNCWMLQLLECADLKHVSVHPNAIIENANETCWGKRGVLSGVRGGERVRGVGERGAVVF